MGQGYLCDRPHHAVVLALTPCSPSAFAHASARSRRARVCRIPVTVPAGMLADTATESVHSILRVCVRMIFSWKTDSIFAKASNRAPLWNRNLANCYRAHLFFDYPFYRLCHFASENSLLRPSDSVDVTSHTDEAVPAAHTDEAVPAAHTNEAVPAAHPDAPDAPDASPSGEVEGLCAPPSAPVSEM